MFPKLNYPVIAGLDRTYLDAVDEAYQKHDGDQLTERETKEFVLMHCFGIVPKLIKTPVDLLKVLLSLHSRKVRLPDFLNEYLLESLTKDATFATWPLAEILPSREKFLRFLQDEWNVFLASLDDPSQRCRVPFSHEDVRAYIDTFFLDGSLTPVEQENVATLARLGADGRGPRSQGRRHAPVPRSAAEVRGRTPQRRRVAPGMAAGGPALGGTGRAAVGVGRGAGRRRPNGLA